MTFTDQPVKPFIGHAGETGDVVHVDQGSSARSNTLSWLVVVNMVRMSSVRFMKNGVIREMGLRAAFSTANRDCRQGNGLPDRTLHGDRGRNH